MNTLDKLNYVNGLHSLMKEIETNAGINRPVWLTKEYERAYAEFKQTVEKENEARNGNDSGRSEEGRADVSRSESGLRR